MPLNDVFRALVPFETNQGHSRKMRLTGRNERVVEGVGFLARRRSCRPFSVVFFDATEWIVARYNLGVEALHDVPGARHIGQSKVGGADPSLDTFAFLQSDIKFVGRTRSHGRNWQCPKHSSDLCWKVQYDLNPRS